MTADETAVVTLNEGNTPLIELGNLPKLLQKDVRILCKFEGLNPTGSFKDRGMTMAISKAAQEGARAVICASTGNTSAAAVAIVLGTRSRVPWISVPPAPLPSRNSVARAPGRTSTEEEAPSLPEVRVSRLLAKPHVKPA